MTDRTMEPRSNRCATEEEELLLAVRKIRVVGKNSVASRKVRVEMCVHVVESCSREIRWAVLWAARSWYHHIEFSFSLQSFLLHESSLTVLDLSRRPLTAPRVEPVLPDTLLDAPFVRPEVPVPS